MSVLNARQSYAFACHMDGGWFTRPEMQRQEGQSKDVRSDSGSAS